MVRGGCVRVALCDVRWCSDCKAEWELVAWAPPEFIDAPLLVPSPLAVRRVTPV